MTDRVEEALAAHLEYKDLGGPAPDTSHLSRDELARLQELIALMDETEGVPFGLQAQASSDIATTPQGERLVEVLRDAVPAGSRITSDGAPPPIPAVEGFVIGTFGGRVRVWLLPDEGALSRSDGWLRDLERTFRLYPDTVAIALVEPDHSCLLVQPEDCAPTIEVPRGALVGRRYRRPVHEVGEALSVFLRELIPHWEPMHDLSEHSPHAIDGSTVAALAGERATQSIDEQVAAGGRARKTNPKRKALTELGELHADALAALTMNVVEGRSAPDDVEAELRRLATGS